MVFKEIPEGLIPEQARSIDNYALGGYEEGLNYFRIWIASVDLESGDVWKNPSQKMFFDLFINGPSVGQISAESQNEYLKKAQDTYLAKMEDVDVYYDKVEGTMIPARYEKKSGLYISNFEYSDFNLNIITQGKSGPPNRYIGITINDGNKERITKIVGAIVSDYWDGITFEEAAKLAEKGFTTKEIETSTYRAEISSSLDYHPMYSLMFYPNEWQ